MRKYSCIFTDSKLDRDRDTTSQDSGISQMSLGNDVKNDVAGLEERMEELNIRTNYAARSGPHSLPYTVNGVANVDTNGYDNNGKLIIYILFIFCIFWKLYYFRRNK